MIRLVIVLVLALLLGCSDDQAVGTAADAGQDSSQGGRDLGGDQSAPAEDARLPIDSSADESQDSGVGDAGEDATADSEAPEDTTQDTAAPREDTALTNDLADVLQSDTGDATGQVLGCADWSDEDVLAVVYGGPKVPDGFYFDEPDSGFTFQWRTPCAAGVADARARTAEIFGTDALTGGERSTDQFHEIDVQNSPTLVVRVRFTRCDYFDGTTLAGAPHDGPEPLGFLLGYLWFTENHNLGGAHILGGVGHLGDTRHRYELCHVRTVYGDFGLCDQISLVQDVATLMSVGGTVEMIEEATLLRTIEGTCH